MPSKREYFFALKYARNLMNVRAKVNFSSFIVQVAACVVVMYHFSWMELTDMHFAYGAARGNGREVCCIYQ